MPQWSRGARALRLANAAQHQRPGAALPRPAQAETRLQALGNRTADVYMYGVIGWDIWAEDLVPELAALDVDELIVHVNSPGGDCFDGIALANTLAAHPATVTVHVEGLAASAASIIAMAGDEIVMHPGARLMVHDALCLAVGNAADHRAAAELLDAVSQDIAGIYASRAGGDVGEWRQKMLAETWLGADEAVTSGLADRVLTRDQPAEEDAPALAPAAHGFTELVAQWRVDTPDAGRPAAPLAASCCTGPCSYVEDARSGADPSCAGPRLQAGAAPQQPAASDTSVPPVTSPETSADEAAPCCDGHPQPNPGAAAHGRGPAPQSSAPEAEAPPAPEPQTAAVNLADLVAGAIRLGVTL